MVMKRLTIFGIILVLIGIGIFYSGSVGFENNLSNNTVQYSIALTPHSAENLSFGINNSTILIIAYHTENDVPVTFFLMNESAFMQEGQNLSSNALISRSESLEGKGVFEILNNSSFGLFPYQNPSALTPPDYEYNGTDILNNGTYYSVFQNGGNLTTIVYYSTVKRIQLAANNPLIYSNIIYDGTGGIVLLVGLGIIGYSIFIKTEAKKENIPDQSIDNLYAKYSEKPAPVHRSKKMKRKNKPK